MSLERRKMGVGDEFGLTEDLYHQLIGRYVATIEVLTKRIIAKDQHIARIETENAMLGAENFKFKELESLSSGIEEGTIKLGDENGPFEDGPAVSPKRKK